MERSLFACKKSCNKKEEYSTVGSTIDGTLTTKYRKFWDKFDGVFRNLKTSRNFSSFDQNILHRCNFENDTIVVFIDIHF